MKGKPVIIGDIGYREPITLDDQKYVRSVAGRDHKVKGVITGPFTLAMSSIDEHYGSQEKLAFAFAEVLNYEARALDGIADIIQVDEPFYSLGLPGYASELIATTLSGVQKPRTLHACGDVSQIFEKLVEFNVDILDHEFAAHPALLDVVSDVDFDQLIGFGCVRSDEEKVEEVSEISERVKKGIDCIGYENLILDPDCGLKHLSVESARKKLENMVKARDLVRNES
jgi:5-methyltetrahydropteroyltriglutamate--homocysteine methyltransferase